MEKFRRRIADTRYDRKINVASKRVFYAVIYAGRVLTDPEYFPKISSAAETNTTKNGRKIDVKYLFRNLDRRVASPGDRRYYTIMNIQKTIVRSLAVVEWRLLAVVGWGEATLPYENEERKSAGNGRGRNK